LIFALLAVSLCLASTAFAQETQREEPQAPKIIRKSGGVFQGAATKRVEPAYPPLAKAAKVSGSVVVEVTLDEEGKVISARALSGHPLLKDAAVAAARAWKFAPTMLEAVAVKVIGTITFNFLLDDTGEIEKLKQQLAADPNSPELHLKLGMAYDLDSQPEKAIEAYNHALRLKPDYVNAHLSLGCAYKGLSQYENALEAFNRALSLKPKDAEEVYMELARTYLRLNRPDEALEAANQALSIKPDFIYADEAHALVGLVLVGQGRYNEALDAFKEAAKMSPGIAQIHFYLGMTYVLKGDRQSATKEYEILKEKDPTMAEQLLKRINNQQ